MTPLETLRHHVTGAIERGEATPIKEQTMTSKDYQLIARAFYMAQPVGNSPECYATLEAQATAARMLADALADNAGFDRAKFLADCGVQA